MESRFFLRPDGRPESPLSNEHDHSDVARRILGQKGIVPKDYEDMYRQMFQLGYLRVVEYPDQTGIHAENPFRSMTREQKAYFEDRFLETGKPLFFNNVRFSETRRGKTVSHQEFVAEFLLHS